MRKIDAIVKLMNIDKSRRDFGWLVDALHAAVELEFFTVPLYLAAQWSVKDSSDPVARSIREIVQEEMAHMSITCNLLAAIGEEPRIDSSDSIPIYPGPLPGGVRPDLNFSLRGLNDESLTTFIQAESPDEQHKNYAKIDKSHRYCSIGEFYRDIEAAFIGLNPPLVVDGQLAGPLAPIVVSSLDDVRHAILLIRRQGEGSDTGPEDTGPDDLAHYYRFLEIQEQRRYIFDPLTRKWDFVGPALPRPDVWPMASVPEGGYPHDDQRNQAVKKLLDKSDRAYGNVLRHLQAAWVKGSQTSLWRAIEAMFELREPAIELMKTPLPDGNGTYGPCFRRPH